MMIERTYQHKSGSMVKAVGAGAGKYGIGEGHGAYAVTLHTEDGPVVLGVAQAHDGGWSADGCWGPFDTLKEASLAMADRAMTCEHGKRWDQFCEPCMVARQEYMAWATATGREPY